MAALGVRYIRLHTFAVNGDSRGNVEMPASIEGATEAAHALAVAAT
jgi:hypothetical protein